MWPDNETDVDLLGFDVLVDELVVALTDERLLPLTVGVLGGWGSGKSSLLKQAYRELAAQDDSSPYICVEFSPWKYEDYEDVKAAFMRSVLDACETRITGDADRVDEIGKLRRFARGFGRRSRAAGRVAVAVAPAVAPGVVAAVDPHAAQSTVEMTSARRCCVSGARVRGGRDRRRWHCQRLRASSSNATRTRSCTGRSAVIA